MDLKNKIEHLYINAIYNSESPSNFSSKVLELIGADEKRLTRTQAQNRARWKYLTMIANILNDSGHNYETPGMNTQVRFNKDLLYQIYWQPMKETLYPNKGRLDTKQFANLTEHIIELFAMIFDIQIPFPDWKTYTLKE